MSWLDETDPKDAYFNVLRELKDSLKIYLGYPPHNIKENKDCRDPKYLQQLERTYGAKLPQLLDKVGLKDLGYVAPKQTIIEPTKSLIKTVKAIYEIRDLYFWNNDRRWTGQNTSYWLCSTNSIYAEKENKVIYHEFNTLIKTLSGEFKFKSFHLHNSVFFVDSGMIHKEIDSLRAEVFVMRLSGLL